MTTDIDVVIPTLNAALGLARTITALEGAALEGGNHDFRRFITVCDGGSRDDTTAIARRCGAIVVTADAGRGGQLAAGADAGSAPWLLFLHADTRLAPGWADAAGRFMASAANADRARCFSLQFDSTDRRAAHRATRRVAMPNVRLALW